MTAPKIIYRIDHFSPTPPLLSGQTYSPSYPDYEIKTNLFSLLPYLCLLSLFLTWQQDCTYKPNLVTGTRPANCFSFHSVKTKALRVADKCLPDLSPPPELFISASQYPTLLHSTHTGFLTLP